MPELQRDVDTTGITKEAIMSQLHITDIDTVQHKAWVVEKLFCAAILNQGTDIAAKILKNYNELRDILYGEKKT